MLVLMQWPDVYRNADTGKFYRPHSPDEAQFVFGDTPRYFLAKGGEGSGKSVAGIIKGLERIRRGMNGIAVSPDLQHFKKSLWLELRRWIPWHCVVPSHRRMRDVAWEPTHTFLLAFQNGATMLCGGIESPEAWEGPNVHWGHFDEGRRHKTPAALKVLAGRVRLSGPHGEPPQLWLTTTPKKHWLFDYFGDWNKPDQIDPNAEFKRRARTITLRTADNAANLSAGYVDDRASVLSEAERRVLLEADWEDVADTDKFLFSMLLWDACYEPLPPLTRYEPCVMAVDAGIASDCFAWTLVSRHPERDDHTVERDTKIYEPHGNKLDFDVIEADIRAMCERYNVVELTYDPYQLHQMMTGLQNDGVVTTRPFNQGPERAIADKQLHDNILYRRLTHSGNAVLRQHLDNADKKTDAGKLRLVKRVSSLKIDAAVALSMGNYRCMRLPL